MADSAPTPFDQGLFLVHLNRGMESFERRKFGAAERELEAARRMRPSDQRVLNLLGLVYFKQEKYMESAGIYRRLIDGNPGSYVLHFNHGLICFKLGSLDQAEAAFLKALDLKPDNQKINFYLGNIYEKKGQHYNALFQYRKAGANIMVKRVQAKISAQKQSGTSSPADTSSDTRDFPTTPIERGPGFGEELQPEVPMLSLEDMDPEQILTALGDADETHPESATEGTLPPGEVPSPLPSEPGAGDGGQQGAPAKKTVVRLTEPVVPDRSLAEVTRTKTLSTAGADLFSRGSPPEQKSEQPARDQTARLRVPPMIAPGQPKAVPGGEHPGPAPEDDREHAPAQLYSHLRRRDDSFRYLENNLMEVTFSGKVFIKQGTIYSYSGNLTFWVKPQREEVAPPLVIVSGTGRLLLTDREREITVLQVNNEVIYVEPSHLLACQESLTPRYAIIERDGTPQPTLPVLAIEGTGLIALSVSTQPLELTVTPGYPVNVSSANVISWSGDLTPMIVDDEALAELMFPHARTSLNIRLEGSGKVMMEKSSQ
jgi:uncharacterized protein (AIM24 family)